MSRLPDFDYSLPYYYMVTLKKLKALPAFSEIVEGKVVESAITRRLNATIRGFHRNWRCLAPIDCFVVMPDHVHLLIKLKAVEKPKTLPVIVWQLIKALERAYFDLPATAGKGRTAQPGEDSGERQGEARGQGKGRTAQPGEDSGERQGEGGAVGRPAVGDGVRPHCFESDWHDWIVKAKGQLSTFSRYIRENPERAWLRKVNAQYFGQVTTVEFLGEKWFAYGNRAILELPVLHAFKGHRATTEDSEAWQAAVATASRIGDGGAGVSTFMSPLEKACGNAIAKAGGKLVVLSPEGFGERWHPTREKERYCAQGRLLYLTLFEPNSKSPTKKALYERSHQMVDLVTAKLPSTTA